MLTSRSGPVYGPGGNAMISLSKGRYQVGFAEGPAEIREAQRLRWLCFLGRCGAGAGDGEPPLDADDYDDRCSHVLIRDKAGGRLVAPVGRSEEAQQLTLFTKAEDGAISRETIMPVRFMRLPGGERI